MESDLEADLARIDVEERLQRVLRAGRRPHRIWWAAGATTAVVIYLRRRRHVRHARAGPAIRR